VNEKVQGVTLQEVVNFCRQEDRLHIVGMMIPPRPGVRSFAVLLEHEHYRPGTIENDDFVVHMFTWINMRWIIVSVPAEDRGIVEETAGSTGVRLVDAIPVVVSEKGWKPFPVTGKTVFTLENSPGHAIYGRGSMSDLMEAETRFINEYFKEIEARKRR